MHKSLQIWGWFLPKKSHLPTHGGGRSGNFRWSNNQQKSGKCHELSRQSIQFGFFNPSHPGGFRGGGGWGSTFHKSGMNCRENRLKKNPPPPPTKGGRSGNFRGSTNQKSGKCHELPRKVIKQINPTPPHQGLGVLKGKNFKCQTFHELEKIDIFC